VGVGSDCDVCVSDWTHSPVRLVVDDDSVVAEWEDRAGSEAAGEKAGTMRRPLVDFAPRAFGAVVLCLGPADDAWPSDLELLDRVFVPSPGRVARWAGARLRTSALTAAMVCSVVILGLVGWRAASGEQAPPPSSPQQVLGEVRQGLDRAVPGRLQAKLIHDRVVVTGILETHEQAEAARQALHAIPAGVEILPRYTTVDDLAQSIRSTAGLPSATIRYQGGGVFSYAAATGDAAATRDALNRVALDLAPLVTRIDASLSPIVSPDSMPILSRLATSGMSVVQTRDGVKHIVVDSPETLPITTGDALDLDPLPLHKGSERHSKE
jgi:type III secretion protein D